MYIKSSDIRIKADEVVKLSESRDPYKIAQSLGIIILERPFKKQLGAYKVIEEIPFIFIKDDLDPIINKIVLLHEIGHHILHSKMLGYSAFITDSSLFGMNNRMEYEANIFAAHISLPDEEFLELIELGYTVEQISQSMQTDPNLISLKVEELNKQGYQLNRQAFHSNFLIN